MRKNIFAFKTAVSNVIWSIVMLSSFSCAAQKPLITATQFGGTPDDDKNDSQQIQALINNAKPGTTLFFPKGIYLIDVPLEISVNGITLKGEAGTVFKFTNGTDWYVHYKSRVGMIN